MLTNWGIIFNTPHLCCDHTDHAVLITLFNVIVRGFEDRPILY